MATCIIAINPQRQGEGHICIPLEARRTPWVRRVAELFLSLMLFTAMTLTAGAQSFDDLRDDDPNAPWHIIADEVAYDQINERYMATGDAEIFKKDRRLTAEKISFDQKNMTAYAEGKVMLIIKEDVLTAQKVEIDLRSEIGTLYNGTIFLKENNFIIRGDRISKVGKQEYEVEKGTLSTCEGEVPDWKITARKLKVTIEGYGQATHTALWAKKVPVFYSPYFIFPAKSKRQTGLLAPEFAFSNRMGTEISQPFFWAISDSQDATFYAQYMSKRGVRLGAEYRYALGERSRGTVIADYLKDRKVDDGTGSSSEDYGNSDDNALRTNKDRYWIRAKIDQALPNKFTAAIDVDWVSDQDYLYDFRSGSFGYYAARSSFRNEFGRELEEYDDSVRTNRLNLNRIGQRFSFNSGVLWRDDVILRNQEAYNPTVQQLPFVQFDTVRQQILTSPVHFKMQSEYAYLYREDGTRGNRAFINPRFLMPLQFKKYFFIEPSIGLSETLYYINRFDPMDKLAAGGDRALHREAMDLRLDLFTEVSRAYSTTIFGLDRIRHRLRPQVVYEYVPSIDQDEYPEFDDLDRIDPKNLITYGLVNTFTYRRKRTASPKAGERKSEERVEYRQFGRLKIEQSYDIREQRADKPSEYADGEHQRPFSPIGVELEFFPGEYVSLSAETEWSPYDYNFLTHDLGAGLEDDRGDKLTFNYHYQKGTDKTLEDGSTIIDQIPQETISAAALLKVTESVFLDGSVSHNIETSTTTSTRAGILFRQQCWSVKAGYQEDEDDRRFAFSILLHGLGGYAYGTSM